MAIPDAVKRQGDAARKIVEEALSRANPPTDEEASPAEPNSGTDGSQAQSAPDAGEYTPQPIELPGSTTSEPAISEPSIGSGDGWEGRYHALSQEHERLKARHATLQGKYNAEVHADIRQLVDENSSLKAEITRLKASHAAAPAPGQQPAARDTGDIDAEIQKVRKRLSDDLGDEQIVGDLEKLVTSLLGDRRSEMSPDQLQEIADLRRELVQARAESRQAILAALVPDWSTIDKDPRFLRFVQQIDPRTGQTYQKLMNDAFTAGDIQRTAFFFQEFKRQIEANSPGKHHQASGSPSPDQSPDTQSSSAGGNTPRVWPLSEIQRVTGMAFAKSWRGDPNELTQLQKSARVALAEGRYDPAR